MSFDHSEDQDVDGEVRDGIKSWPYLIDNKSEGLCPGTMVPSSRPLAEQEREEAVAE